MCIFLNSGLPTDIPKNLRTFNWMNCRVCVCVSQQRLHFTEHMPNTTQPNRTTNETTDRLNKMLYIDKQGLGSVFLIFLSFFLSCGTLYKRCAIFCFWFLIDNRKKNCFDHRDFCDKKHCGWPKQTDVEFVDVFVLFSLLSNVFFLGVNMYLNVYLLIAKTHLTPCISANIHSA